MNLTLETMLLGVASTLRERITPSVSDSFAGEMSRLAAMLVTITANAVDDAAAARVWENAALRALFEEAPAGLDPSLASRLAEATRSVDPGLKISELDRENDRLRKLLVELHAAVEQHESAAARALDVRIWVLLREAEMRRAPQS